MSSSNDRSTKTRFCFPKEVYKHKHNIRFVRPGGFFSTSEKNIDKETSPGGSRFAKECKAEAEHQSKSMNKGNSIKPDLSRRSDIEERAIALLNDLQKAKNARLKAANNGNISTQSSLDRNTYRNAESAGYSRGSSYSQHTASFRGMTDARNSSNTSNSNAANESHLNSLELINKGLRFTDRYASGSNQSCHDCTTDSRTLSWLSFATGDHYSSKDQTTKRSAAPGGSLLFKTVQGAASETSSAPPNVSLKRTPQCHTKHPYIVRQDSSTSERPRLSSSVLFRTPEACAAKHRVKADLDAAASLSRAKSIETQRHKSADSIKYFGSVMPERYTRNASASLIENPRCLYSSDKIPSTKEGIKDCKTVSETDQCKGYQSGDDKCDGCSKGTQTIENHRQHYTENCLKKPGCSSRHGDWQLASDRVVSINKQTSTENDVRQGIKLPQNSKNSGAIQSFRVGTDSRKNVHILPKPPVLLPNSSNTCIRYVESGSHDVARHGYKQDIHKKPDTATISGTGRLCSSSPLKGPQQDTPLSYRSNNLYEHFKTDSAPRLISSSRNINWDDKKEEVSNRKRVYSEVIHYPADIKRTGNLYNLSRQESLPASASKKHIVVTYGYSRPQKRLKRVERQIYRENVFIQVYNPGNEEEERHPDSDLHQSDINKSRQEGGLHSVSPENRGWMPNQGHKQFQWPVIRFIEHSTNEKDAITSANRMAFASLPGENMPAQLKVSQAVEAFSVSSHDTEVDHDETDSAFSQSDFGGEDDDDDATSPNRGGLIGSKYQAFNLSEKRLKGPRLYRFLVELLEQPDKYSCIEWVNKEARVFKFLDSKQVALLWGIRKNKANMKFENFARSLRCYKTRGILKKPRQKLVYQFAEGW